MVNTNKNYWFLGACFNDNDDQSEHFINKGEWLYNGNNSKDIELIRLISTGDQVAIKATYVQTDDLPFDTQGYPVSVMKIKAIGTVIDNPGDGKSLKIEWQKCTPEKKWYFYTSLKTIWQVNISSWQSEQLVNFTFHNQPQDINRFCNAPYWRERFGDINLAKQQLNDIINQVQENNGWQQTVLGFIQELCQQNDSGIFTRQQFLNQYQQQLQILYPNNKTIGQSVSRTLQELRDKKILFFKGNGQYKLSDYNSDTTDEKDTDILKSIDQPIVREPYTLNDLIAEGCFIDPDQLAIIQARLTEKKNLILQGPPGTGKTWLAKRLAHVIVGYRDFDNIKAIQFHPNMSYEDFIRGYRPSSNGKLELIDGPFIEIANRARNDANTNYVVVIEEVNRGNPAQIFGEMLTLLEANKRTAQEALELTYKREHEKGFFIPDNLYVIGTMNIADRSLAMVDFALRRRFAFFNLHPHFGDMWREYMTEKTTISPEKLQDWQQRMHQLNQLISDDPMLGAAFTIGHSYLTSNKPIADADNWFRHIIQTEIQPLLAEYWFDEPDKIKDAIELLLSDAS
ncbi:AAA family ATPase [Snodgrassella gandavensis]|uniref:AAA family ATPase n=1 Tax=Snodgrassella gandavensis TaxID=2946698 RepID=UPI001EF56113|nr:AAA family ATPase [Snodgrassella gandavensis]